MKNFKDIILILVSNILADTSVILTFYLMLSMIISMSEDNFISWLLLFYIILISMGRNTILPVVYNYIFKNSQISLYRNFINNLKLLNSTKIITVTILTLFSLILNLLLFDIKITNLKIVLANVVSSLFIGILGSYIFLFLYWYIRDKFKENYFIQKLLDIMINKYTCIFSVIAILLGYIVIIIMVLLVRGIFLSYRNVFFWIEMVLLINM